jgi:hypothetical protein
MGSYGRPLWRLYSDRTYEQLREFVQYKLLGGIVQYDPENRNHVFAAVASRVSLDPALNKDELASEAVNSHLRLVTAVDSHAGTIRTITPSEPVVADAVAALLLQQQYLSGDDRNNNWTTTINTLVENLLSRGLVEKGNKGELYARLMCILARDYYLDNKIPDGVDFKFSQPFLLSGFLDTLTGCSTTKLLSSALSAKLDTRFGAILERAAPTLDKTYRKAYVNFSHFAHTESTLLPGDDFDELLRTLFRTHCGLQLCFNQPTWDLLIPIYFGELNEPYDKKLASALFIQVKNKENRELLSFASKDYINFFEPSKFIVLLQMELGVEHTENYSPIIHTTINKSGKASSGPWIFGFRTTGHRAATFPVLTRNGLDNACSKLVKEIVPTSNRLEREICDGMMRFNRNDHAKREG